MAAIPTESSPAIAGVAQIIQRPGGDLAAARGPIELMIDAARAAATDAGAPGLLARVGFIGVAGGWFRYCNPGQLIADRIGAPGAATALTAVTGTGPQDLVGVAAERIAKGQVDVALVVGGEARWSHQRISRAGGHPTWITDPGEGDPEALSPFPDAMMVEARALGAAAVSYALFEDSLRASHGTSVDEHRDHIAALWARFSAVAEGNPYAWDRSHHDVVAIRNPSPANRMIAFPYPKAMVANNTVDMATAIILCRADVARDAGVSLDRLVFPHVVTSSHETWMISERHHLHGAPALTTAGHTAFAQTGLGPDDIDHIDLYACFPSIVQMSSAALGIDPTRELTVTGGLGFAGAPVGNAVGHSIAAMVERVRGGGIGLVHGNGGQATKHSFAVYSTTPPARFERIDVQGSVDHQARTRLDDDWTGLVTVEAATVVHDHEGPTHVLAAVLNDDGHRGFARTTDTAVMDAITTLGIAGRPAHRGAETELHLDA